MTRPSPALIAEWYGKLRRAGFCDIEGGRDLNKLHAWTFRGGTGHGPSVESWPEGFEPQQSLADHPTAVYYRGLAAISPRTSVLALVATIGNASAAARARKMSRRTVNDRERTFAKSIGLFREAHGS